MSARRPTLILQSGDPAGDGPAVWVPVETSEQMLRASGEHLVFLPGLDYGEPLVQHAVAHEFERRYPLELPGLERLRVNTRTGSVGRTNGRADWSSTIESVQVRSLTEARVIREGFALDNIVAAAQQYGVLPVAGSAVADVREWQAELAAEGCCLTCRVPDGEREKLLLERHQTRLYEVRHDPAGARRRERLRRTRTHDQQNGAGSATGFLTVAELIQPVGYCGRRFGSSRGTFETLLAPSIDGQGDPWSVRYKRRPTRYDAVRLWEETIERFNTLYGRNAHRHVPEFQTFIRQVWRKRGAATQRMWLARRSTGDYGRGLAQRVFAWFERESRVRKPKPRDLARCVARRREGLFTDASG